MARYYIRMELHKLPNKTVQESDYQILHEEMDKKGFYSTVTYEQGDVTYELPTGTYRQVNTDALDKSERDALAAGNATVNRSPNVGSFSFFLVEYSNSRRHNLKRV
jgi:hypothetical protein